MLMNVNVVIKSSMISSFKKCIQITMYAYRDRQTVEEYVGVIFYRNMEWNEKNGDT